jgi:Uma2 family endonuclease
MSLMSSVPQVAQALSVAEFWALAETQSQRLELIERELVALPPSSAYNSIIAVLIATALNNHVLPRKLGYVTGADGGYRTGENSVRQPDVAFIRKERFSGFPKHFDVAPDLAVEVVSPSENVMKRAHEYFRAGTQIVWAVMPDERTVYVMTPVEEGQFITRELGLDDTLDGGTVLPDLRLPLRDIFPEMDS